MGNSSIATRSADHGSQRTSRTRVVVLGGRGGGAIVAQSIRDIEDMDGSLELVGFLNDVLPVGSRVSGARVLGEFSTWSQLSEDIKFVAPLHKAKEMQTRARLVRDLGIPLSRWATVVDPMASVASDASLAPGTSVGSQATVSPAARVGAHVAIRAGAVVSHDTVVGDNVYVGPNTVLCGYARVEEGAHIAPGALVLEYVEIGRFAVVGLGSVVLHDIPDFAIAAGNPARVIGQIPADSALEEES